MNQPKDGTNMASIINADKNAPSRSNANKSPKASGDWSSRSKQSFPKDYGIGSKRFGKLNYADLVKSLRGRNNA